MVNKITKSMAAALAKFHEQELSLELNGEVSFGKTNFKYATLGELYQKTKAPLKESGLTFTHFTDHERGCVVTVLVCLEDESSLISSVPIDFTKQPKEFGALITYGKRYTFAAVLGLSAEDDKDAVEIEHKPAPTKSQWEQTIDKVMSGEKGILEAAMSAFTLNGDQIRRIVNAENIAEEK